MGSSSAVQNCSKRKSSHHPSESTVKPSRISRLQRQPAATPLQQLVTTSSGQMKHTALANSFRGNQHTISSIATTAAKLNPLLPPQQAETNAEHQLFTLAAATEPLPKNSGVEPTASKVFMILPKQQDDERNDSTSPKHNQLHPKGTAIHRSHIYIFFGK
ncbi:hypothetical protein Nepgr_030057 [Nepenthes gracilis]|uniref:Uncharacterized protein n=1 Tax=Nepenthes gracilis TaxID=150966 RepID=A0AAD3Y5P8_NEPGR|nr:hypothetical protein Nepgr_030057 [Nepenthes gracilis]